MNEIKAVKESEIVFYQDEIKNITINVIYSNEDLWLNQATIAELFAVQRPAITKHLKNIFESG